jgi:hypothetical protein
MEGARRRDASTNVGHGGQADALVAVDHGQHQDPPHDHPIERRGLSKSGPTRCVITEPGLSSPPSEEAINDE